MARSNIIFDSYHPLLLVAERDMFGGFFCEDKRAEFTSPTFNTEEELESFLAKYTRGVILVRGQNGKTN